MSVGKRKDPYLNFRFCVEIHGLIEAGFSEVSGLDVETETEDYPEGGVNDFVHKLPKRTKHQNIILKRGITDSDVLWKWHQEIVSGKIERKSGRIILLGPEGSEKWSWSFEEAYPVKWKGPDFKGDSTAVAVETLELAHKGIKKG
jgi:phage tail-like protein